MYENTMSNVLSCPLGLNRSIRFPSSRSLKPRDASVFEVVVEHVI